MNARILIVDDDANLIEGLRWYLEAEGFGILSAVDGETAVEVFRREQPDMLILDIMMPKMDGVRVCETISSESDALIMMLSARDSDIDKVRALKLGADDYVTKPFNVSELVARIQALIRRKNRNQGPLPTYRWRNLELSLDEHRAKVDGSVVELTTMEFDLLVALMEHPQVTLSREQLVETIWGSDFYGEYRLVDNLVFRLREKLAGARCADFPIVTVRGVGYAYRPEG
ncbi:MAG: response regulator transcription factor [Armatimonadetes bacterium]|jgi:two-component system response regulator VicR|nr:response regulator transcription factor [Armatimonadota bacterium]